MLADDILAVTDGRKDRPWHRQMVGRVATGIRAAQRFVVDGAVVDEGWDLLRVTPMETQLRALALCVLPFPICWFEWSIGDGNREGLLVDGDAQHGRMWCAFTVDREPCVSPIEGQFDWREHPTLTGSDLSDAVVAELLEMARERGLRRESREDYQDFARRHAVGLSAELPEVPMSGEELRRLQGEAFCDLQALRAVILLLNSRNYTRTKLHTASAKLQLARARAGKAPLLDHTRIDIRLHPTAAGEGSGLSISGDARNPVRWHSVRAHPRVLPKGVVRVRAHTRGSIDAGTIGQQTRHIRP